eukprot:1825562-Amphidinium_carterae.1
MCARTNAWIRTEGWRAGPDELGEVWSRVPQQENEVMPGTDITRQQLENDGPIPTEHIRLTVSLVGSLSVRERPVIKEGP